MSFDPTVLAVAATAAFLAGLGKGGLALMGMFGVPILSFVMSPLRAAAILLPVFVFSDAIAVWLYRRQFSPRNLKILIPAGAAGIALGWATASRIPDRGVDVVIGVIGVLFCLNSWRMRAQPPAARPADVPQGIFWGSVMGFVSFVSHSGGAPFQIYVLPQRLPKLVYAGTNVLVFAAVNLMKIGPYWALGQLSLPNLNVSLLLMIPAFLGTQVGSYLVRVLPPRSYFAFVQIALLIVSLEMIVRALRA